MKHNSRLLAKAGLFVVAAALATGCSRKSRKHAPQRVDTAQTEVDMGIKAHHRASLLVDLRSSLHSAFRAQLAESGAAQGHARLSDAAAFAAADATALRLAGERDSDCKFDVFRFGANDWLKCVVKEVLAEDLSSASGLRKAMRDVIKEENKAILGDIASLRRENDAAHDALLASLAGTLGQTETIAAVVRDIEVKVNDLRDIVAILRDGVAINDVPWLSQGFFEGRRFLLTNALQQASVGVQRAWNFDTLVVRFELNAGRLFLIREKAGIYDGENGEDVIISSYPVVATRKVGGETFYQVNFAEPLNKRYMLPYFFGYDADPAVEFTAESVRIRVAHLLKQPKSELGNSGIYFTKNDASLVLDQLVLMNGTGTLDFDAPLAAPGALIPSSALKKDWLRPTIRFTQGLIAIGAQDDAFANNGAMDIRMASEGLLRGGKVEDTSQGADYPYFPAGLMLPEGKKVEPAFQAMAQKFNVDKGVTFVISANTPPVMVAPIKSAVMSYANLFAKMTPADRAAPSIRALTQAEFEEENRTAGLKIGNGINAADPRVNMIFWEDVPGFSAAWGTSATNPLTGEVISGDIMLSGTMWAKSGCQEFMLRRWAAKPREGEKPQPFPHPVTYALYNMACNMTLLGMRVVGPAAANEAPLDAPINPQRVLEATVRGDNETLKSIYFDAIGASPAVRSQEPEITRSEGETDVEFGERIAAWYAARKNDLRSRAFGPRRSDANLKATLDTARSEAKARLHGNPATTVFEFVNGKNAFRLAAPTCNHAEHAGQNLYMANAGVPGITTEKIADAKQAAMAMIRIVTIHELGHLFGLKHNFIGSTTPAALEDGASAPVPLATRTDSIMDYNDAGVELEMGAMSDYTSPEGGLDSTPFGVYDVLAMANLYNLDASGVKLKTPAKFCSDGSKNLFGNCLPFDFGKNSLEHTLFQANVALQEMRTVKDSDFSNPFVQNDLQNRLTHVGNIFRSNMTNLLAVWGNIAQMAAYSRSFEQQNMLLKFIDLSFYARGATQPFLADEYFLARTGMKPVGIWDALHMTSEQMQLDATKPQMMAEIGADNIREYTTLALLGILDSVNAAAAEFSEDARFLKGIPDFKPLSSQGSRDYLFRTMLIEHFAAKMLLPANAPVTKWVYLDGDRREGSTARDPNGNPIALTFDEPFFNHTSSVRTKRGIKISDGNGGEKEVMAIANGSYDLKEMIFADLALGQLAPWGGAAGGSPAFERLLADRNTLAKLLGEEKISQEARAGAKFVVSALDWMLAKGFQPFEE